MFGPLLRLWSENRAIPLKGKLATVGGISISVAILIALTPEGSVLLFVYCGINALATIYILSRPSAAPAIEDAPAGAQAA